MEYIGSSLIPKLLSRGYEIHVVDLLWFGNNLLSQVEVTKKDAFLLKGKELEGFDQVIFLGGQGGITIGNNVIMGPGVKIFSENHKFNLLDIPIRLQGETRKGVHIDDNCWIGAGVIILDGVEIQSGCIVAAGSVVTKSAPQNSFIAGIPAKYIKQRSKSY